MARTKKVCKNVKKKFKFDIKEILKKRRSEEKLLKQSHELDEDMIVIDALYQESVNQIFGFEDNDEVPLELMNVDHVDQSNYNIPFNENADIDSLCIQRLQIMSIEGNELEANIHFNLLIRGNWSPEFGDVQNILCKWGADLDTPSSSPSLKYQNIGRHNFELVIKFIYHSILKKNKKFSVAELLTIAKYIVTIYFDHPFGQMINEIKALFGICIETASEEDNDTNIMSFAQELYSKHNEDDILNIMIVDLFLPLRGEIMKKMYTYLTFKLYKSLLGKTDDTREFPSSIKEWFVQDLVDNNYLKKNPKKVSCVIKLLEHVVIVFDLYEEEEKLNNMYNFLKAAIKPNGLLDSLRLINILDQWRLQLFRIHVNRKININDKLKF